MQMLVKSESNYVQVVLEPGEIVKAEPAAFLAMSGDIKLNTKPEGGIWKGIHRSMVGEDFFIPVFENVGTTEGVLLFTPHYPASLYVVDLSKYTDHSFVCQKKAFLCSSKNVDAKFSMQKKVGAGFFGGEGFVLQRLQARPGYNNEVACVAAGGYILEIDLDPGETINIETGALVGMESTVECDVRVTGGVFTMMMSGENMFFTRLTGPGTVLIQTVPIERFADNIAKHIGFFKKSKKSE